ncbi:hypothetical protein [Moraxella lincolnii]|uniref:hypothetical protein n=1 Tax=Lwoffella lincolnii TaxID=90241 RepID=UPI0039843CF4
MPVQTRWDKTGQLSSRSMGLGMMVGWSQTHFFYPCFILILSMRFLFSLFRKIP